MSADEEAVERGIRSIGTIADLAAKHGASCEALAVDLAAFAKREAPALAAFKQILADPAKQKAMTARFGERIQTVAQATVNALREHCGSHPAVQQLFKALEST
jgi:hypothetical protein